MRMGFRPPTPEHSVVGFLRQTRQAEAMDLSVLLMVASLTAAHPAHAERADFVDAAAVCQTVDQDGKTDGQKAQQPSADEQNADKDKQNPPQPVHTGWATLLKRLETSGSLTTNVAPLPAPSLRAPTFSAAAPFYAAFSPFWQNKTGAPAFRLSGAFLETAAGARTCCS